MRSVEDKILIGELRSASRSGEVDRVTDDADSNPLDVNGSSERRDLSMVESLRNQIMVEKGKNEHLKTALSNLTQGFGKRERHLLSKLADKNEHMGQLVSSIRKTKGVVR